jgi:hypothetical protein
MGFFTRVFSRSSRQAPASQRSAESPYRTPSQGFPEPRPETGWEREQRETREFYAKQPPPPRRFRELKWRYQDRDSRWLEGREPEGRWSQSLVRFEDGTTASIITLPRDFWHKRDGKPFETFEINVPGSGDNMYRGDAGAIMRILGKLDRAHKLTKHARTR